ncbi:hypothetical protein ElyMa_002588100, partial [Elysia marginata]
MTIDPPQARAVRVLNTEQLKKKNTRMSQKADARAGKCRNPETPEKKLKRVGAMLQAEKPKPVSRRGISSGT